jgi:hypothetical protein
MMNFQKITLKDIDFENLVFRRKLKIALSCKDAKAIIQTIKRDVEFLKGQKLMDYSILLGIELITNVEEDLTNNDEEIPRTVGVSKLPNLNLKSTSISISISKTN